MDCGFFPDFYSIPATEFSFFCSFGLMTVCMRNFSIIAKRGFTNSHFSLIVSFLSALLFLFSIGANNHIAKWLHKWMMKNRNKGFVSMTFGAESNRTKFCRVDQLQLNKKNNKQNVLRSKHQTNKRI